MGNDTFSHDGLAHDLANHLRSEKTLVWENMQMGRSGSCRPDVYFMRKSFTDPRPTSYEIKISVSDFRSDVTSGKWESYLPFSRAVIFATPKGLVKKEDIPTEAGWIVRHEKMWRIAKKPTLSTFELSCDNTMKLLIDGVDRFHEQKSHVLTARATQYTAERAARKAIGEKYGELIAKTIDGIGSAEQELQYTLNRIDTEKMLLTRTRQDAKDQELSILKELGEILNVDGNSKWEITSAINRRMKDVRESDELQHLKRKITAFEKILKSINPAMDALQSDFWVKEESVP